MKNSFFLCLLMVCFCSNALFAKTGKPYEVLMKKAFSIPINYSFTNKKTVLFLPNSCSGLASDYVAGEGTMVISVQGKIQNGQLSAQVKVDLKGSAQTTVGSVSYNVNGNMSVSETKSITTEPVDVFVKGLFKLVGKNKASVLYLGKLGYLRIFPDGTVVNYILSSDDDVYYSHPEIYCNNPSGN